MDRPGAQNLWRLQGLRPKHTLLNDVPLGMKQKDVEGIISHVIE